METEKTMKAQVYKSEKITDLLMQETADFLAEHLDQYGDKKEAILKCLQYAKGTKSPGGGVILACDDDKIVGAVILNKTGMAGYIPENILVYIAVHRDYRGKGVGKLLMDAVLEDTQGDIALHVEADNPARKLYEKYGFTNKYLEYRLTR